MSARVAACAAWLLLASAPGCRQEQGDTQVMVEIDAEHAIRARIRDVELEVKSGQGPIEGWTPRFARSLTHGRGAPSWPLEVALVPRGGQTERNYVASATARDEHGRTIAQVRAISGYVDGKSLRLPLLFDRACLEREDLCGAELTCRAGACVDPHVEPASLLPFATKPQPPDMSAGRGGNDGSGQPSAQDAGKADAAALAPADAASGPVGTTCAPGTPGCAAVPAVPVEQCPDARCAGCADGFVKDDGGACVPLLVGLGVSSSMLSPALNALDTRYALELGLLVDALVITPLAADGVRIEVDGTAVGSGEQYRLEPLSLGQRNVVIGLSKPGSGARTYTIELTRAGAQRAYLKAGTPRAGDRFGYAVAIDGETIVVGAPDQGAGTVMAAGGAHVFTREGSGYALPQALSATTPRASAFFGTAVAIDGDTLAVGAPGDTGGGAVYVYVRGDGGWSLQARLPHPAPTQNLEFGSALALRGDTLVVGSPGDDRDRVEAGAVFFFTRDGSLWSAGTRLAPSAPQAAAWFGSSVALDGDRLAVGATGESTSSFTSGAAYVFERSGGGFVQRARVVADNPGVADFFGEAVGLAGDTLVVGGFASSTREGSSGAIYVYEREGDGERWPQVQQISAHDPSADALFGARLAFAGDVLVTGASQEDSGGTGVGSDGSGPGRENSGAGYVFMRRAGRFEQVALLKADNADPGDLYGFAVALDGDTIVLGADGEASASDDPADNGRARAGAVYVVR